MNCSVMITNNDSWGEQLPWFAIDGKGHIGSFKTYGDAAFPASAFGLSWEDSWAIDDFMSESIPITGKALESSTLSKYIDFLNPLQFTQNKSLAERRCAFFKFPKEIATRGIYVYKPSGPIEITRLLRKRIPTYCQIMCPENPIHISQLPKHIREAIEPNRFDWIRFDECELITIRDIARLNQQLGLPNPWDEK